MMRTTLRPAARSARAAAMVLTLGTANLVAGTAPATAAEDSVVARSGAVVLTESAVREMIEQADPRTREQVLADPALLSQFVRGRLARMAILAEAKEKKWDQTPAVVRQIEQAKTDVIIDSYIAAKSGPDRTYPSEAEVETAYEANKSRFVTPRQYRIAQIFIAVPPDAAKDVDDKAQKRLRELQQQARGGKADFAELARRNSDEKASAAKGGDLDWVSEDRLLPQVREAVAGLEKGGISDLVRVGDGWHLLKLLDTRPASVAPLSEVRDQLIAALRQQRAGENANAFVVEFLRKSPVQVDEIELSRLARK